MIYTIFPEKLLRRLLLIFLFRAYFLAFVVDEYVKFYQIDEPCKTSRYITWFELSLRLYSVFPTYKMVVLSHRSTSTQTENAVQSKYGFWYTKKSYINIQAQAQLFIYQRESTIPFCQRIGSIVLYTQWTVNEKRKSYTILWVVLSTYLSLVYEALKTPIMYDIKMFKTFVVQVRPLIHMGAKHQAEFLVMFR